MSWVLAQKKALEVQHALFDYFIDIRYSLKGRLPQYILLSKAKQFYKEYCVLKVESGAEPGKFRNYKFEREE